jgi:hypothetical protein
VVLRAVEGDYSDAECRRLVSKFARQKDILRAVSNTKNVDGVALHFEENTVDSSFFSIEELAKVARIPLCFGGEAASQRISSE